ncbi:MAG TPA: hypothetical protein VKB53_02095 [Gammaproteobacteria bacterium]|nr:hypothetical protein [Gammaproteobacteria bacterium]
MLILTGEWNTLRCQSIKLFDYSTLSLICATLSTSRAFSADFSSCRFKASNFRGEFHGLRKHPTENRILGTLPRMEYNRLLSYLKRVALGEGQILNEADEVVSAAYFPNDSEVSLLYECRIIQRLTTGSRVQLNSCPADQLPQLHQSSIRRAPLAH